MQPTVSWADECAVSNECMDGRRSIDVDEAHVAGSGWMSNGARSSAVRAVMACDPALLDLILQCHAPFAIRHFPEKSRDHNTF